MLPVLFVCLKASCRLHPKATAAVFWSVHVGVGGATCLGLALSWLNKQFWRYHYIIALQAFGLPAEVIAFLRFSGNSKPSL